jgi:methylisocitrate lyase
VHIEDQVMPKRLGSMAGISVIDADEMADKIRIACKSRNDPNFVIIGRTDAYGSEGLNGVIRRCRLYADAGADLLYPHTICNKGDLEKLAKAVDFAPLMHDVVEPEDRLSDRELENMGYKVVIHGRAGALCQAKAVRDLWAYYKEHGETRGFLNHLMSQEDWARLIDNDAEANIRDLLNE